MRVEVIRPRDLSAEHKRLWTDIQHGSLELQNPYFSHQFASILDIARDDARTAVLTDSGHAVGFFPFHEKPFRIGAPIGGPISDYHGLIAPNGFEISPAALLRGCGLDAFDYNHALSSQRNFAQAAFAWSASPALDLSSGYDAYRKTINATGTSELKSAERKMRKIEREVGPLRFVANDESDDAWIKLLKWKNAAYDVLGVRSILDVDWALKTLELIRASESEEFAGMLSSLYAGEALVAAHFGMRSRTIWHWWFPTYAPEYEKYSPGIALLLEMARWGGENGIIRIDLGRGDARYKLVFGNAETPLCEGSLAIAASPAGALRRFRTGVHRAVAAVASPRVTDLQRRALNRALGAGRLS
ncbi:MAG: GNAT family N-acetyltransferase [Pseudomonadota bacterium]